MDRPVVTTACEQPGSESTAGAFVGVGASALHLPDSAGDGGAILVVVLVSVAVASTSYVLWRRRAVASSSGGESTTSGSSEDAIRDGREEQPDDREVVRREIRARGGRTRQSVIVEETGWSKAKVSSVLASMEEEGSVSKLRVGRENLVSLPGHEPDAVGSSLEE